MRHEEEKIVGNTRDRGRSRGELASELGISSQPWLSVTAAKAATTWNDVYVCWICGRHYADVRTCRSFLATTAYLISKEVIHTGVSDAK